MPTVYNKVTAGGSILIDLSQDTVTSAAHIMSGHVGHLADGTQVAGTGGSSSPTLQSKTATPSESQQTVTPDSGYDGLSSVTVGAISSTYVGSSVARKSSSDLTASSLTVTAPVGYYASDATKTLSDANLVAGNIKKDVSIFGVTGTYEGGGGSSVKTGTVTVAAQTDTLTINIGISNPSYFCMFLASCSGSFPGYKSFSLVASNFTRWLALGTNNAGTGGSYQSAANGSNGKVELSGTSVTITGPLGSGTKLGNIQPATWVWFAG